MAKNIVDVNLDDCFAIVWDTETKKTHKVIFDVEVFENEIDIAEGGFVVASYVEKTPYITIISQCELDDNEQEFVGQKMRPPFESAFVDYIERELLNKYNDYEH